MIHTTGSSQHPLMISVNALWDIDFASSDLVLPTFSLKRRNFSADIREQERGRDCDLQKTRKQTLIETNKKTNTDVPENTAGQRKPSVSEVSVKQHDGDKYQSQ